MPGARVDRQGERLFVHSGLGEWAQQAKLKAANAGIDGDGDDNSAPDAGAAYVFTRDGTPGSTVVTAAASGRLAIDTER